VFRHELRTVVHLGEEALEEACAPDEDVDHVDAALRRALVLLGDPYERIDLERRVGEVEVMVGWDEPEQADERAERDQRAEEALDSQ
jgi:hypothetical protein